MDPSLQGKANGNKKAVNAALFEIRYMQDMNAQLGKIK